VFDRVLQHLSNDGLNFFPNGYGVVNMFKNLPLLVKQMIYFSCITLILVVVGLVGLFGMRNVGTRLQATIESGPLIYAAMEMKMAVASDLQLFKSLEAAQWPDEVEATWSEHEKIAVQFTALGNAILKGGETEAGVIQATQDERLQQVVTDTLQFYDASFHAKFKMLADLITRKISAEPYDYALLDQLGAEAGQIGDTIIAQLKDVETGVKGSIESVNEEARKAMATANTSMVAGIAAGVLLALLLGFVSTRNITRPVRQVVDLAQQMAEGDFTRQLTIDRKDEIGMLVAALNRLVARMERMLRQVVNSVDTLHFSSGEMTRISDRMAQGANLTAGKSNTVATAAEEMNVSMNSVSAASEQATTNVSMVADAVADTTETIKAIAGHSEAARTIADRAMARADHASAKMNELGSAADAISKVTEVITEISEQTNLLALNATIEAARAGEAGKGFAVVANEIKGLARQTAEATHEIKARIEGIQHSTDETVGEMKQISEVINQVNDIVATIATSVDSQLKTTEAVAGNVREASLGFGEINENVAQCSLVTGQISADIADVKASADELTQTGIEVSFNVKELSQLANKLHEVVTHFHLSPSKFDIASVKKDHTAWLDRLTAAVNGELKLSVNDVIDHKNCELGRWYDSAEGQALAGLPGFAEAGRHHEEVHRLAREVVALVNRGERAKANGLMKDFNDARTGLFGQLDTLYCA
jgi:methyl-accepting chemotaxis protein